MKELEELKKIYGDVLDEVGLDFLAEVNPDAMKGWFDESKARFESGVFDPKTQELIFLGCAAVSRSEVGVKLHTMGATRAGATKEEIVECLLLASLAGSHPILSDGLRAAETVLKKK